MAHLYQLNVIPVHYCRSNNRPHGVNAGLLRRSMGLVGLCLMNSRSLRVVTATSERLSRVQEGMTLAGECRVAAERWGIRRLLRRTCQPEAPCCRVWLERLSQLPLQSCDILTLFGIPSLEVSLCVMRINSYSVLLILPFVYFY